MAGHNKWSKVKRLKGAQDAKRGKVFSKLSREITVAVKQAGGDPSLNARLRMGLLKARAANMPADSIERAIKKGTGETGGAQFEDLTYEIYGPGGVAILAEASTDNRNRTAAEIRSIVTKAGGSIAAPGAVSRLFDRKGQIIVSRDAADEDDLMELAVEAGAEDFRAEAECFEMLTDPSKFESVHQAVDAGGIRCEVAEVTSLPSLTVFVTNAETATAVIRLIEALEEHDDVNNVYSNAELPEDSAETGAD